MRAHPWSTSARAAGALLAAFAIILGSFAGAAAYQRTVLAEFFAGSG